jgi:hypothetical protein
MSVTCSASMARLLTVIITAVAWFFISNHCVLAEFKGAAKAKTSCHQPCCGRQPPAKSKTESAVECCKTLHATLLGAAKDFGGYDTSLFALQLYFAGPVIFTNDSGPILAALELDTGPPFVSTFVESVLQRSILAHAPPLVV